MIASKLPTRQKKFFKFHFFQGSKATNKGDFYLGRFLIKLVYGLPLIRCKNMAHIKISNRLNKIVKQRIRRKQLTENDQKNNSKNSAPDVCRMIDPACAFLSQKIGND